MIKKNHSTISDRGLNYGYQTTCPLSSVHRPSHILPCVLGPGPPPRRDWPRRRVRAQRPSRGRATSAARRDFGGAGRGGEPPRAPVQPRHPTREPPRRCSSRLSDNYMLQLLNFTETSRQSHDNRKRQFELIVEFGPKLKTF